MQFQKYEFAWDQAFPELSDQRDQFPDADILALIDSTKTQLFLGPNPTTLVSKRILLAFRKDTRQEPFRISIPEARDPLREYYDLPIIEREEKYRPKFADLDVIYFAARVKKADGQVKELSPLLKIEQEVHMNDWLASNHFAYHFDWNQIDTGDLLEISWQYYLPYWVGEERVFFASDLPSLRSHYSFEYPANQLIVFHYGNNGNPKTIEQFTKKPARRRMEWSFEKQGGGLSEVNSRIHKELPFMQYYVHDHVYAKYNADQIEQYVPYTWQYKYYKQLGNKRFNLYTTKKVNGKEIYLNSFYSTVTAGTSDPLEKMIGFHELINEDFAFSPDKEYLEGRDFKLERMVQHVKRKIFRKISRFRLYESIFNRIGENYHKVHVSDARISEIDANKYLPIIGEKVFFAAEPADSLVYFLPKESRAGLHANELPFYLQKQRSLLVGQMTSNFLEEQVLRFVRLPANDSKANSRTNSFTVRIDPSKDLAKFEGKISLSGQFSTLLRGFYKFEAIDSTVNPGYYKRLALDKESRRRHLEIVGEQVTFPYEVNIQEHFDNASILSRQSHGQVAVDLKNWFPFVFEESILDKPRYTYYYTDFAGKDEFNYQLNFDQVLSIVGPVSPLSIENEFGSLAFDLRQTGPKTIEINCALQLSGKPLSPSQIDSAKEIFEALRSLQSAILLVELH